MRVHDVTEVISVHEYSLEWVVEVGEVRERDGVDGAQVEVLVPVQQLQVRVEVL